MKIIHIKTMARSLAGGGLLLAVLAACGCAPAVGPATNALAAQPAPRVSFASPSEGATVASPFTATMQADNFVVEAAGAVKPGAGHLHIMVDVPCVAAGQGVPKDDAHLHYGQGQLEAGLTLSPGRHTLCLQAADGNHIALPGDGMTQMMTINVE